MLITTKARYYDEGVLRLPEPLVGLHDGEEVDLQIIIRRVEGNAEEKMRALRDLTAEWLTHPPQIFENEVAWQDFHAFLQANRFDLPERDLDLGDE